MDDGGSHSVARLETLRFGHDQPLETDNFDEYVGFSRNYVFSRLDDRPFHARAAFWDLDGAIVTEQTMGGLLADRSSTSRSVDQADHITIVAIHHGRIDYHGADGVETCEAGDLLALDYRRRFRFTTPGHHAVTVSLQRAFVEDHVGTPRSGKMPPGGEADLLHDFLGSLARRLPEVAAASAPTLALVLRKLLLLTLRSFEGPTAVGGRRTIRAMAVAYMDARVGQGLDVHVMSEALGLSRSSLYRAFADDGGLIAFDRARRLRSLHQAISDGLPGSSLGTMGARYGFYDLTTLARQFRSYFGYTMSDLRDHVATTHVPPSSDDSLWRFRQAVTGLSR